MFLRCCTCICCLFPSLCCAPAPSHSSVPDPQLLATWPTKISQMPGVQDAKGLLYLQGGLSVCVALEGYYGTFRHYPMNIFANMVIIITFKARLILVWALCHAQSCPACNLYVQHCCMYPESSRKELQKAGCTHLCSLRTYFDILIVLQCR